MKKISPKGKAGAPSMLTAVLLEKICARLATGETLTSICREAGMPDQRTVRKWMQKKPEVAAEVARARVLGFDALAEECLLIADDAGLADQVAIARAKLRISTRLELLSKWDPKRYGARVAVESEVRQAVTLAEVAAAVKRSPVLAGLKARVARN